MQGIAKALDKKDYFLDHYREFAKSPADALKQLAREDTYAIQGELLTRLEKIQNNAAKGVTSPEAYDDNLRNLLHGELKRTDPYHVDTLAERIQDTRRSVWEQVSDVPYAKALQDTPEQITEEVLMPRARRQIGRGKDTAEYLDTIMRNTLNAAGLHDMPVDRVKDPELLKKMVTGDGDALLDFTQTRLDPTLRMFSRRHGKGDLRILKNLDRTTDLAHRVLPKLRNAGLAAGVLGLAGYGVNKLRSEGA